MSFESELVKRLLKDSVDPEDILPACKDLSLNMNYDLIKTELKRYKLISKTKNPKDRIKDSVNELIEEISEAIFKKNYQVVQITLLKEKNVKKKYWGDTKRPTCNCRGKLKKVSAKIEYLEEDERRAVPLKWTTTIDFFDYCIDCGMAYDKINTDRVSFP